MTSENTFTTSITRRTFLSGLAGATTAASLLASCGTTPGSSNTGGGQVTLHVWGGVPAENGPQNLVEAFQKANPGIKVVYTRFVNDDTGNTKLETALQGGTPIDIYFSYNIARMSQRIKAGLAEDFTSLVQSDTTLNSWATSTEGIFKYEDKFYSLPTTREPNFVVINKNMLDAASIQIPENWTVNDFHEIARKLSKVGDKPVYGSYTPPNLPLIGIGNNIYYKNNGSESNFDHPLFKQNLELHTAMIKEKSAFPWTEVLAQNLRAYAQNPFLTQQDAMWITASFSLRYVSDTSKYPHDFVTTFAPMPRPVDGSTYYNGGSLSNFIMMHPKSKQKEAAWKFIRFWLNEGSLFMLKAGKNPVLPGVDENAQVDGILGPDKDKLYDVEAYKKVVFAPDIKFITDTITVASAQIAQIAQAQTDRCLIGEISPEQCVATMKQQSDEAIKKAGS